MSESMVENRGAVGASGRRIVVQGTVQGVGFRPWVARLARERGVSGEVWNAGDGVVIEAFAAAEVLDGLLARLAEPAPPAARVQTIEWQEIPLRQGTGFTIAQTAAGALRRVSISPDLATCPRCAGEIVDPQNRRFHYPFTNCTDCGPRFTIALDLPYDRATTTMAPFAMCPRCRREYANPHDRRYHAEPNACPECGPRLRLTDVEGRELGAVDPLRAAARALQAGLIVAIQGLGGFHLACDAGSGLAVARLRQRKHRDEKPFAVMVRDLERAWQVAELSPAEEDLLLSVERPIVVARRTPGGGVCAEVAPENPWIGLLLPYTPLHHLLFTELDTALVMTSANPSGEPLAISPDEARARLSGVADLFLVHDRAIAARCDDSVVRWIAGGPVLLRRSRGYVPRAVRLAHPVDRPVLGCGGQLKNTFCIALGDEAFLGPHAGDLESLAACDAYGEAVERMERFLGVVPEVVAHDLHRTTSRPGTLLPAPASTSPCSTTTPTSRARSPSTVSTGRCSASPGTAPATAATAPPGGASCCSATRGAARASPRCGRWCSPAARRRSTSRGGSPWRRSTTPSTARRRSSSWRSSIGSKRAVLRPCGR